MGCSEEYNNNKIGIDDKRMHMIPCDAIEQE
jgi:hypothetical protein